jgi:hypothetical protein
VYIFRVGPSREGREMKVGNPFMALGNILLYDESYYDARMEWIEP